MMEWDLIADIGGTNCRLARLGDDGPAQISITPTSGALGEAFKNFAAKQPSVPKRLIAAGAGVRKGDILTLTNANASIDIGDLKRGFPHSEIHVLNDFEAAAWALADPAALDLEMLQNSALSLGPKAIMGVGTGLGVGVYLPSSPSVLKTEAGHVMISPRNLEEVLIFERLAQLWPEASAKHALGFEVEALVSGLGLPILMGAIQNTKAAAFGNAADVLEAAKKGDRDALLAVKIFASHLGALAGNLFTSYWATGGIILSGGVLTKNPDFFRDDFLRAFNDAGRYAGIRRDIPLAISHSESFGLSGCACYAKHLDHRS